MSLGHAIRGLIAGAALALAAGAALADVPANEPDDMALGSPKARVEVIEYASVGCPHCAEWNNTVFPAFKARYIDSGKVRFVVREMLTGSPALATAGWMLARCAGPEKYFPLVEAIYRRQTEMFQPGAHAGPILKEIALADGGLDETAFEACLQDQQGLDAVNARARRHGDDDKVELTPTFFVNGQRMADSEHTLAQMTAAIVAARHGR